MPPTTSLLLHAFLTVAPKGEGAGAEDMYLYTIEKKRIHVHCVSLFISHHPPSIISTASHNINIRN